MGKRLASLNKFKSKSRSILIATDVELYQRIEHLIGKKLPLYNTVEEEVMLLAERVSDAQRVAKMELKDLEDKKKGLGARKKRGNNDDTEEGMGVINRMGGKTGQHK